MSEQPGVFPVESDEDPEEDDELAPAEPGQTRLKDWWVYPDSSRDKRIGIVHVFLTRPWKTRNDQDRMVCRVVFDFGGDDTLSASGMLPFQPKPHWIDSGRLTIVGGTGEYANQGGELVVEVLNPKRWSIEGP